MSPMLLPSWSVTLLNRCRRRLAGAGAGAGVGGALPSRDDAGSDGGVSVCTCFTVTVGDGLRDGGAGVWSRGVAGVEADEGVPDMSTALLLEKLKGTLS